jgi:hypothetical protein
MAVGYWNGFFGLLLEIELRLTAKCLLPQLAAIDPKETLGYGFRLPDSGHW